MNLLSLAEELQAKMRALAGSRRTRARRAAAARVRVEAPRGPPGAHARSW